MNRGQQRVYVSEKGETVIPLTLAQAAELQELRFCRVSPTAEPERWRISDVQRVGTAVIGDIIVHVVPKASLENVVYMASVGHRHIALGAQSLDHASERALPNALARAFLLEVQHATRRGLVKGYREVHESAAVMRGRWDVSRQLAVRPGLPLPLEVEYDDFTEDVTINRILHTAVRAVRALDLPRTTEAVRTQLEADFREVGTVPRGTPLPAISLTRLTEHLGAALTLARVILDAVSWTHRAGPRRGGTFLVNMASIFEAFVAERLSVLLADRGFVLTAQDRRWWLDAERSVTLRPDIVLSDTAPVGVADTKYKVLSDGSGAPPNGDVYQMVAYALALHVPVAHLIYVSGDVVSRVVTVPSACVEVRVHAVDLGGTIGALEAEMERLASAFHLADASN